MDPARFGKFCNADEWAISDQRQPKIHCLTKGQAIGLTLDAEAGIFSVVASATVLILIARNVVIRIRRSSEPWRLFDQPADIYLFWLFVADLVTGFGFAMNIPWVVDGKVYTGKACTAQGALRQVGEVSVAIITLSMAVHTFVALWMNKGMRGRVVPWLAVAGAFLFSSLAVAIGNARYDDPDRPYIAPTPYWCWIAPEYTGERLGLQYVILWLNLAVSLVLYTALFLLGRGNITQDPASLWGFRIHRRRGESRFNVRVLRAMMAYPLLYSLTIMPLSLVRWIAFTSTRQPPAAVFFAVSFVFGLSGVFNVALFFFTRKGVLLFGAPSGPGPATRRLPAPLPRAPSIASSISREREPKTLEPASAPEPPTATSSSGFARDLQPMSYEEDRRLTLGLDGTNSDFMQAWRHDVRRSDAAV